MKNYFYIYFTIIMTHITYSYADNVSHDDSGNHYLYSTQNEFLALENQYSIGYGFTQMNLINGAQQQSLTNMQSINIELEHLFYNNIWFDINLNTVVNYSQANLGPSYLNGGGGGQGDGSINAQAYAFGQNPFMYSLTAKGGYAFNLMNNDIQITPYVMFGRNANFATSTIVADDFHNLTTDFFLTGGLGFRFGYKVKNDLMIYLDELYSYNWDNSGAIKTVQTSVYGKSYAATNYQFTSTLGVKYNINSAIQLSIDSFWNNYQHQSNIAGVVYTPQNTFGEMISLGLTY